MKLFKRVGDGGSPIQLLCLEYHSGVFMMNRLIMDGLFTLWIWSEWNSSLFHL